MQNDTKLEPNSSQDDGSTVPQPGGTAPTADLDVHSPVISPPTAAANLPEPPAVALPPGRAFEPDQALPPREAFFGPVESVPAAEAAGRICAEQITPYPPGIPAVLPGEVILPEIVDYLRTGLAAGMVIPDAADPSLDTFRCARRIPGE